MKRAYIALLIGTLALALILGALGRRPHTMAPRAAAPADLPAIPLTLEIRDGTVSPASSAVPKGRHVALHVLNRGSRPASLALTGYEDRLKLGPIAPGGSAIFEFHADRPGDEFSWLVDGAPAGRFAVTGSHLSEGHE